MRFEALIYLIVSLFVAFLAVPRSALAQNEAIFVNGEPITSYDVVQRTRWVNRTSNFGERAKALLRSDEVKQKFREMMIAENPRSEVEANLALKRVKKELIEYAKRKVLNEGDATKKTVIEALIDDKLKLQKAKALGIEIADDEVDKNLAERIGAGPDGEKLRVNAFYAQFETDGISRKTIQEIIRAQLAWRRLIRSTYGFKTAGCETYVTYESFSRCFLEKLRRDAIVDYREP